MSNRPLPPAPPWLPATALWATIFLGPFAGALVTAANLRRLARPDKALFALLLGVITIAGLGMLWAGGAAARDSGLLAYTVLALGDSGLFFYLQQDDYGRWRQAHPREEPATAWTAAPWALVGFALTLGLLLIWLTALTLALLARGEL